MKPTEGNGDSLTKMVSNEQLVGLTVWLVHSREDTW